MTLPPGYGSSSRNSGCPAFEVVLKRGSSVESTHRVHAVICDTKGRILMKAGRPDYETFVRSALKPFQALPALSSGASGTFEFGDRGLAISCASHAGTPEHAREAFRLLWNAQLETESLQCPIPSWGRSPLEHNCSGKHAAFLATSRKMAWPLDSYLKGDHPLQQEVNRRVAEFLGLPAEELVAERDDCGAPTLLLQLSQMALLYAHLGASAHAELEQISRAMLAHPKLVAGEGRFDTELMSRSHKQVISKGGAEGIQCLSRTGDGLGVAIKAEDGSRRAKQAVALHLLRQLDWMTQGSLDELEDKMLIIGPGVRLEVNGELRT
ncbi:MAG: asparaginase [Propionibacteriaceae bacterium]|jgi:L-asparaginase|nr:asparaginase [Propionibacteriaceae bacterium]MBT66714.1 asparaginase [Synechococcus sp. NP17]|tara:strand:+ start:29414 stop:30385 length:972 start_codon:yes stop_codon:yes gene_type:complete